MRGLILCLVFLAITRWGDATLPTRKETLGNRERVEKLLEKGELKHPQCFSVPEGGFVYVFHPELSQWVTGTFDPERLQKLGALLKPHLQLSLTKEGFTPASARWSQKEVDPTAYNAIWVRDCCWQYWGLKLQDPQKARTLMLALLTFYSTPDQLDRFKRVILDPAIADPEKNPNAMMDVPLIRFASQTLTHYEVDGKPQQWNHLQFDSHGYFLMIFADAIASGLISAEDLKQGQFEMLALFPAFFQATRYYVKKDAGPWEEELLMNASSAGLVASGLQRLWQVFEQNALLREGIAQAISKLSQKKGGIQQKARGAFTNESIASLVKKGEARVLRDLSLGGEAPNISGTSIDRTADAALLFLCTFPGALFEKAPDQIKEILAIDGSLIGPFGVQRYQYDAYQAANFWISFDVPSKILGPTTNFSLFATRLKKGFMPAKNCDSAQWFFDSIIALAYYNLTELETDQKVKQYYLAKGDLHLKRALGQFTGPSAYSASGEKLPPLQLPESINTIITPEGRPIPAPSPICPLGWSVATMQMALEKGGLVHRQVHVAPTKEEQPHLDFKSL